MNEPIRTKLLQAVIRRLEADAVGKQAHRLKAQADADLVGLLGPAVVTALDRLDEEGACICETCGRLGQDRYMAGARCLGCVDDHDEEVLP